MSVQQSCRRYLGCPCVSLFTIIFSTRQSSNVFCQGALPAELSELSMLEAIQLEDNNFSGEIPPEWGRLGQLDQLELGRNHLTGGIPKELGKLLKIRVLRLDQNQLTGSIPKELGDMKSIRFFEFLKIRDGND